MPLVLCATAAGLCFRIAGAMNDLWLDETWSLELAASAPSAASVFWGLSHDNNHTLNTLWMRLVGEGAHSILYRAPPIFFGTAACLVAARLARRHGGPEAGVFAAILFASGLLFVNYGSEARGYGPMAFGLLVAADALDEWLRGDTRLRVGARLAGGLALASFYHLLALPAGAIMGAIAAVALWWRMGPSVRCLGAVARLALLFFAGLAPAAACFIAGIIVTGDFARHSNAPYTFEGHLDGLVTNLKLFIIPLWLPFEVALLAGAVVLIGASAFVRRELRLVYVAGVLATGAIAGIVQAPDPHYPRFHFPFSLMFAMLVAVGFAGAWKMGGWRRATVATLFAGAVLLNVAEISLLPERGRGQPRQAVEIMASDGPSTYIDLFKARAPLQLAYHIRQSRKQLEEIELADFCARLPEWVMDSELPEDVKPTRRIAAPDCAMDYRLVEYLWTGRASGHPLSIYRRMRPAGTPTPALEPRQPGS